MKDIVIIANFVDDFDSGVNSRFIYLAKLLSNNNSIELITSDFSHHNKCFRQLNNTDYSFKITFIHELGYSKNVSLRRFISHIAWGENVKKYLKKRKNPDVIYCAVPSLTAALNASVYCKKNKVEFIIDIQDLWPEAFKMVFNIPVISEIIFIPFNIMANKIYSRADKIIAVSQTYLDRALRMRKKSENSWVVYLGTDKYFFDKWAKYYSILGENYKKLEAKIFQGVRSDTNNLKKIAYVGTLGHSYDIKLVLDAIKTFPNEIKSKILFIVMGDGPLKQELEQCSKDIPVLFTGQLPYQEMIGILSNCDIAVNPIVKGAAQSIINKHMDYAMAGLPIVNTQENKEYANLLNKFNAGINCACGSVNDVAIALRRLINDDDMRIIMGRNSRKMGEELFDRAKTYQIFSRII